MFAEIILILICVLIFLTHYKVVHKNYFKKIENFDSIGFSYPIIGHLHIFLGSSNKERARKLSALPAKCKKTAKIWFFSKLIIALNTPQDIQTVTNSIYCLEKGTPYKAMRSESGLIALHPDRWRPQRRLINPSVNLQAAVKFIPQMYKISCDLIKDLESYCDKGEISLLDIIGIRLMESTESSLFGQHLDKEFRLESYDLMQRISLILGERVLNFYFSMVYAYFEHYLKIISNDVKLGMRQLAILDKIFLTGKQKYMPEIEKDAKTITTEQQLRNKPDGFLKRIFRMSYHNRMNDLEFEETAVTMLYGGTDSSGRAICNVLLGLAMYPEIQEKLYAEIKLLLGDTEITDFEVISQMEYLDRVIKESLRFFSIIPLMIRRANKDIQLEHGIIPSGTDILISTDNIHKKESIWGPNVNKFDPDHFLPENCAKRHPCSYIPFSYGPRNCIGYRYAQTTLRVMVANLVRNYKFDTSLTMEEISYDYGITSQLMPGYNISLTKR